MRPLSAAPQNGVSLDDRRAGMAPESSTGPISEPAPLSPAQADAPESEWEADAEANSEAPALAAPSDEPDALDSVPGLPRAFLAELKPRPRV